MVGLGEGRELQEGVGVEERYSRHAVGMMVDQGGEKGSRC
jgi:hypothetical protein